MANIKHRSERPQGKTRPAGTVERVPGAELHHLPPAAPAQQHREPEEIPADVPAVVAWLVAHLWVATGIAFAVLMLVAIVLGLVT